MLVLSLIPYLTIFVANNLNSLLPQVLYGLNFIIVDVILVIMSKSLVEINKDNEDNLKDVLSVQSALKTPLIIFMIGFIIALLGYPIAISICCLLTVMRSIIHSLSG